MIKKLLARPYHLFLLIAIVLFVVSFFHFNTSLDIHLHDTYYIIAIRTLYQGFAIIFWLLWTIYHFTYRFLYGNILIWSHLILTLIFIPIFTIIANYQFLVFDDFSRYMVVVRLAAGTIIAGQCTYPINLITGLIKHHSRT
ncbi:hypothetical protein [Chitinophaga silvisoli]|uniref:Uncharacterized protein n=1 Tax=Chitinophaga silvisoli TaxID=2291814 RepID=A0A3E1P5G8_9BACT|nr:hypothetical protein [Chitinophaga silvisoli]RFM35422.1 hypothetical protein DXN04_08515 [Chitinophaga silvisoli]